MAQTESLMDIKLDGHFGSFSDVARIARTSTDTEPDKERDAKLVRYLHKNKHTSPFEFVVTRWDVKCPIFVARQWMRHRMWSYSERSGRYTEFEDDDVWYPLNWRQQGDKNRQASGENLARGLQSDVFNTYSSSILRSFSAYKDMIDSGVSREMARGVLPQAVITRFFAQTDMHNLMHFIALRDHEHAQPEIAWFAKRMKAIMRNIPDLSQFVELMDESQQATA